ncbi:MAG: lipid II flippase MurJ, partial [Nitrospira sp.]
LFALVLMSHLGAAGLALATALAAMVNGGILVVVLNRRLGGVEWESVIRSAGRVLVACVPIVMACWWVADAQIWAQPADWTAKSAMLVVAIGVSVGGYLGVHALFQSEELGVVWGMVRRKLGRLTG